MPFNLKTSHSRKIKGFSLIELMIVVSLMGLLFVAGVANYRSFARRKILDSAVNLIRADLKLAQTSALSGVKPMTAECDSPNRLSGYALTFTSSTTYQIEAYCTGSASPVVSKSVTTELPNAGVSVATVRDSCSVVGSPTTDSGIFFKVLGKGTLLPSGQCFYITISQTGTSNQAVITVGYSGEIF